MEQQSKEAKPKDDTIATTLALILGIVAILAFLFVWFDVYHRIAHMGEGINLCRLFAELARQEVTQYAHGMCR